jgi:hypothetical protein
VDLRPDGNYYLYHRPDGRWVVLPHDLDMMFIAKTHQPGFVPQARCLSVSELRVEFQGRAREILDLFAEDGAPNGGQIGQLIAELSGNLAPQGQERNWAELDEAMWNWHPRNRAKGQFNLTPYQDHRMGGRWERSLQSADFAGFCKYILEYCTDSRSAKNYRVNDGNQLGYGFGYLSMEARDDGIPDRPSIRGIEPRRFSVSPFASPESRKFAAVQWRVAWISAPGLAGYRDGQRWRYEIEDAWTREFENETGELILPAQLCSPGQTYRVRARYKDDAGRWSHWSRPAQFVGE